MLRAVVPLVFFLVLQLRGSDGGLIYQTVREGDDVTLSCENVLPDQHQCELTDWSMGWSPPHRALFIQRKKDHAVSSSVSLLQNCSMVLHRVTKKQAGEYTCEQDKNEKEITDILLYVASLSQEQKDDRATVTCSVTPDQCQHEVKWLNNGEEVTVDHTELQMSHSHCGVSVSFKHQFPPSQFYQTLKCEVKQRYPDQIFTLFPRAPDNDGFKTTTAVTVGSSEATPSTGRGCDHDRSEATSGHLIKNVLLIVGLVTLLLSVAAVHLYARVKERGASERSRTNVNRGGTVVYENVAEPSVSVRFHSQPEN